MKINDTTFYIVVLVLSAIFLFVGNRIASGDGVGGNDAFAPDYFTGVVTILGERIDDPHGMDTWFESAYLFFDVRLTSGGRRGEIIPAEQHINTMFTATEREVEVGDRILLIFDDFGQRYIFATYVRINAVAILGIVFLGLVILFGRKKGFNAIVALGFTCLAVFLVFIPALLSGRNIYATTLIVCVFAIVSTLMLVIGPNKKALSAMLGCLGGVLFAGILMFVMDGVLSLTGIVDGESFALLALDYPVDLRALIFAGVIIGAVGAIMDVAMSISSSLWEVHQADENSGFASIMKSGINIGKDILGTMLNTLILAYIGSSLSIILLISAHATSMHELFNMEMIIVEFLRALVGSFGMLLTIPLTAGICGWLYTRESYDEELGF